MLEHAQFALKCKVNAIELDLHYRDSDGQIVVNHDEATEESPTLEEVIRLIVEQQNGNATVNDDGQQFFLVLEPKENEYRLFSGIVSVLERYTEYLSTAVSPSDPARGITVVITGDFPLEFYNSFNHDELNRLCVLEFIDYGDEISNLSVEQTPFQWVSIRWRTILPDDQRGRVKLLRDGGDLEWPGKFNVRVWDCGWNDLGICLATEASAINIDRGEVEAFQLMLVRHFADAQR